MKTNQTNTEVTEVAEAPAPVVIKPTIEVEITPEAKTRAADKVPANWKITCADDSDIIEATNMETRSVFSGTIAEFNTLLKG